MTVVILERIWPAYFHRAQRRVKFYAENNTIKYEEIAKQHAHSDLIGAAENRILCTTPGARLSSRAQRVIRMRNYTVHRESMESLLDFAKSLFEESFACPIDAVIIPQQQVQNNNNSNNVEDVSSPTRCSLMPWRKGQLDACEAFFKESSSETTTPFRVQLPCGYGKTALIALICQEMRRRHPSSSSASSSTHAQQSLTTQGRVLVHVPSKDLLHQTKERLHALLPLDSICIMGDGETQLDPTATIVIATYNQLTTLGRLDGTEWSLIVEVEGHHNIDNRTRQKLNTALKAQRVLALSATFPTSVHVDFKVSMREAIEEGVISDYRLRIVELSKGDKEAELLQAFQQNHVDWGPTMAVFNDMDRMYAFAQKLCEAVVRAECVTGQTPAQQRQHITERLELYMTDVVCVFKCWNEGKDVPILRTVVFCDRHDSDINKKQLA